MQNTKFKKNCTSPTVAYIMIMSVVTIFVGWIKFTGAINAFRELPQRLII